jgi:hypothetical protein
MLGNTQPCLLNQRSAVRNVKLHKNAGTRFCRPTDIAALRYSLKFFASAALFIISDNTDVAEIMHFIHNQDGKKRI